MTRSSNDTRQKRGSSATAEQGLATQAEWLAKRGLGYLEFPTGHETLEATLGWTAYYAGDAHYLLCAKSRSGFAHAVVCRGDKIVHDPILLDRIPGEAMNDYDLTTEPTPCRDGFQTYDANELDGPEHSLDPPPQPTTGYGPTRQASRDAWYEAMGLPYSTHEPPTQGEQE